MLDRFDENLSEELVNEKAVPSSIKTSLKLIKNMSATPFQSKLSLKPRASFSRSSTEKAGRAVSAGDFQECFTENNKLRFEGSEEGSPGQSSLQSDIKSLLQKAILLRNEHRYSSKKDIDCNGIEIESSRSVSDLSCERCVTMKDIIGPQ